MASVLLLWAGHRTIRNYTRYHEYLPLISEGGRTPVTENKRQAHGHHRLFLFWNRIRPKRRVQTSSQI